MAERFNHLERSVLNFHSDSHSVEEFLKKTGGPVRLSAIARPVYPVQVHIELLARSKIPGFFGRKWLLRHIHPLSDFETQSGAIGHPNQEKKTFYEELRLPMHNANAFLPHLARRIESHGRTAEFELNDWDKSFDEVEAEQTALKNRKKGQ